MKLYKSDLELSPFWDCFPDKFKTLKEDGNFISFAYTIDENTSEIELLDKLQIVPKISMNLYQATPLGYKLGYFQYPIDTQNTLFYMFFSFSVKYTKPHLKDDAIKFFRDAKLKDLEDINKRYEKTLNDKVYEIYSRDNFVTALDKFLFCQNEIRTNTLSVIDAIDNYSKTIQNKSIYGEVINKVVQAVANPNGGLIPDTSAKLRYLYVGENSKLVKDENSEYFKNLEEARKMFRNGFKLGEIYVKTRWFRNTYDNKWRMSISDKEFEIPTLESKSIFITPNSSFADRNHWVMDKLVNSIRNKKRNLVDDEVERMVLSGWDVVLGDVIKHPTLFRHYPELYNVPTFYMNPKKNSEEYSFYFSDSPKMIMMYGSPDVHAIKETFIHEIQHAIQRIENFGTGGNYSFAILLKTIGGEGIKQYLFSAKASFKIFENKYKSDYKKGFNEYWANFSDNMSKFWFKEIGIYNEESFEKYFYLLYLNFSRLFNENDTNVGLKYKISKYFGEDVCSLLDTQRKLSQEATNNFKKCGINQRLQHMIYEALSGEIESRNVQQTRLINSELEDYFTPLTSETILRENVNVVYDGLSEWDILGAKKIDGAIEKTKEGKYIIHLYESAIPTPIIHEIGHLVHDLINLNNSENYVESKIKENFKSINFEENQNMLGEIFCDLFLGYISRLKLSKDFSDELLLGLNYQDIRIFDKEFSEIFYSKEDEKVTQKMMDILTYLKKLNEII